jgi:SAM-dependent methyltransferase
MDSALENPALVEFFTANRTRVEDLYVSERRFLPWLASTADTVLDVGCAAGGFVDVWHALNADTRYRGVDVSTALVAAARERHPDVEFAVGDAAVGIDLPDRSAAVVQALGWLHWEPRYRDALRELWRLTDRQLFFDVRLIAGTDDATGAQAIAPGVSTPYICAGWTGFAASLLELRPATILGYGYAGAPAETVDGAPEEICFATFVLERREAREPTVCLDLPLPWPTELGDSVQLLPAQRLETLAPSTTGGTST